MWLALNDLFSPCSQTLEYAARFISSNTLSSTHFSWYSSSSHSVIATPLDSVIIILLQLAGGGTQLRASDWASRAKKRVWSDGVVTESLCARTMVEIQEGEWNECRNGLGKCIAGTKRSRLEVFYLPSILCCVCSSMPIDNSEISRRRTQGFFLSTTRTKKK